MTKLTADTILDAVDERAPIDSDKLQQRIVYEARASWCDLAYKGRFEEIADRIWGLMDELREIVQIDDALEAAHAIFDIAEQSGELSEAQIEELVEMREWIDSEGGRYNWKRALQ
jgi:DNA-directed RNA polymerase delta subunit